jgi:hypothetical protein
MRLKDLLPKFLLSLVDISIELVTIFADRELLIIINRDINLFAAHRLILRIVELRYIGMSQCLFCGKSLVRVEVQEALEKVQRIV